MLARRGGDVDAAEHPRDLFDAGRARERRDLGPGGAAVGELRDAQVPVGEGGDLRQVGHAKHLGAAAERGEFPADDLGDRATDARIDFIEHHAGPQPGRSGRVAAGRTACERDLHGERQAREFAARGDARQRPRRLAGIGRHQELDLLEAGRRGESRLRRDRLQADLEATARHAERLHARTDGGAELLRGAPSCCGELLCAALPSLHGRADAGTQAFQALTDPIEPRELGVQLRRLRRQLAGRHAVFARQ